MSWVRASLGEYVVVGSPKVVPTTLEEPQVEHYSLPALDAGAGPELVAPGTIRSTKQLLDRDYVLVSKLNPFIPRVWRVGEPDGRLRLASTEFLPLRPRTAALDIGFLRYLCETPAFIDAMAAQANGTSSSHQRVSATAVLSYEVELPTPEEQRAIISVLGAIDDKIVADCDAIRKAEALLVEAYAAAVTDPARKVRLDTVASTTKGVSYSSDDLRAGGSGGLLFSLKCFSRDGALAEAGLKPYGGAHKPPQRLRPGDVVVAQTDLTQDASVIGRGLRVPAGLDGDPIVASLDAAIVRTTTDPAVPQPLLAVALRTDPFREHCRSQSVGTTVLHLRAGAIESFELLLPSRSRIDSFVSVANATFDLTDGLRAERRRLAQLRHVLLPQLLSGARRIQTG
ncbi:MAG: restriction endonuclease subunit S [Candidatus Limnocylindrales bacterium]